MRTVPAFGGSLRPSGGRLSRFSGTTVSGRHDEISRGQAALSASHPAVREGRTIFPTRVFEPADAPRLLVSGHNSAKIGAIVHKGPWRGLPIYTLTLEERATCPDTCDLWRECYGNSMPLARRHAHGPDLIARLDSELASLLAGGGIAVRLHVLGDFWSLDYARAWFGWLSCHPGLHVWGYTAHPVGSDTGGIIAAANIAWPGRCVIRFSVAAETAPEPLQASTIWAGEMPDGRAIICPAQTGGTQCCATCALCWAVPAADARILFRGHGRIGRQVDTAGYSVSSVRRIA